MQREQSHRLIYGAWYFACYSFWTLAHSVEPPLHMHTMWSGWQSLSGEIWKGSSKNQQSYILFINRTPHCMSFAFTVPDVRSCSPAIPITDAQMSLKSSFRSWTLRAGVGHLAHWKCAKKLKLLTSISGSRWGFLYLSGYLTVNTVVLWAETFFHKSQLQCIVISVGFSLVV